VYHVLATHLAELLQLETLPFPSLLVRPVVTALTLCAFQSHMFSHASVDQFVGMLGAKRPRAGRSLDDGVAGIPPRDRRGGIHECSFLLLSSTGPHPGAASVLSASRWRPAYSRILDTTPAPTVLPPSRIANRSCSSIAIG